MRKTKEGAKAMPKDATQQTRSFKMHPALLMSVIQRQAGHLSKAILEGVMNAVDAKATRVDVTLAEGRVVITDDGQGFRDAGEIERFFETFGQPHEESEHKTYGCFRMGRGQLFAYGRNEWRTGTFHMKVDIKAKGLDYDLHAGLPPAPGCTVGIDLYKARLPSELRTDRTDLEQAVKYCPIPVTLNGERISEDLAKIKWDHETPEAFVKLSNRGGLEVYNLGVFVQELPAYKYGTGGVVVSRKQLRVNFARNDVMENECPVWRTIAKLVNVKAKERNTQRREQIDDAARARFADQIRDGEVGLDEVEGLPLFTDSTGRNWSLKRLAKWHRDGARLCAATTDHALLADKVMQHGLAFVFAESTLERFGVASADALLKLLRDRLDECPYLDGWQAKPFKAITANLSEVMTLVPEREWSPTERAQLAALGKAAEVLLDDMEEGDAERALHVGLSDAADGWTDGASYIAIDRRFLRRQRDGGVTEWTNLALLMLHEYCHRDANLGGCEHGADFYQSFHDRADKRLGRFVAEAVREYPKACERLGLRIRRDAVKAEDAAARAVAATESLQVAARVSSGGHMVSDNEKSLVAELAVKDVNMKGAAIVEAIKAKHPRSGLTVKQANDWAWGHRKRAGLLAGQKAKTVSESLQEGNAKLAKRARHTRAAPKPKAKGKVRTRRVARGGKLRKVAKRK